MKIFEAQHITAAGKLLPFSAFRPFIDLPQTALTEPVKVALWLIQPTQTHPRHTRGTPKGVI